MKRVLEGSRYLTLLAVGALLAAAIAAMAWGVVATFDALANLIGQAGRPPLYSVELVALMDRFLVAAALLLFAIGLYELFVGELAVPAWLKIRTLHDLKTRLASVIVLVMAVTFLEHLIEWEGPLEMLYYAGAIALVSAALIAFAHIGGNE